MKVALLQRQHGRHGAVHAGHAEVLFVRVGERAPSHERRDDRGSGRLGERLQLSGCTAADHAAADVQHRLLRLRDERRGSLDLLAVSLDDGAVSRQVVLGGPDERRLRLLGVLRDVDEHGARAAGRGDLERLSQRTRHVLGALHEDRVLRHRHRDADDVGLLERVGAHERREHLSGDRNDRHGVHVGVGDRGDEVRGARARRGDRHADLAARRGVALGRVAGALLVAHEDVVERVGPHERVIRGQDRASGQAEHVFDAEELERSDDGFGACQHGRAGGRCGWPGNGGGGFCRHSASLIRSNVYRRRAESTSDGTQRSGTHELRVLGENAAGVSRRQRLPALTAGGELSVIDE